MNDVDIISWLSLEFPGKKDGEPLVEFCIFGRTKPPILQGVLMTYRWVLRPDPPSESIQNLARELNDLPATLAQVLIMRGIDTFDAARLYFRPSMAQLHDPFLMLDMEPAADRILQAIHHDEKVLVYGDYDVDGTTATALMTSFLRSEGVDADFFIPDRIEDGYGLSNRGIDRAQSLGATVVIALDCGITAVEEAAYAKEQGIDLIICDHHKALETVPGATAVLDAKRAGCTYPFKELSGCGVGYKLVTALLGRLGKPAEAADAYLDLVAVSTASDIVPLEGENRILMREGLKRLRAGKRLGFRVLAQKAGFDLAVATTSQILFGLGPRINAAGRLGDAGRAVELMLTEDPDVAQRLADELETANQERRAIDRKTQDEAGRIAERLLSGRFPNSIVAHHPEWHPGVVGIVASRMVERFYRPAVLLTTVKGEVKGSARSIAGVNVYNALKSCEDLLSQFGGHDYAAGLTLPEENLDAFRERFDAAIASVVTPELLTPAIEIDAAVNLDVVPGRFWSVLKQFAPFGPANMEPVFLGQDLVLPAQPRRIGKDGSHVKFRVSQREGIGNSIDVIGFRMAEHFDALQQSYRQGIPMELLFTVEENTWNGRTSLQLKAKDLRLQEVTAG